MSGNRLLFLVVVAILTLLVVATVILATGSPEGPTGIASLVQTVCGVGVVLLIIRLVREAFRRR